MTGRSENSNAQDEKGKESGADEMRLDVIEMAGEVGVKWGREATELVYAGGKDTECVDGGPVSADMD